MLEVEIKYHISAEKYSALLDEFTQKHYPLIKSENQRDTYFSVVGRDSMATKECLRIRSSEKGSEITYKPPTNSENTQEGIFAKEEINITITDEKDAMRFLMSIGNTFIVTVEKERKTFICNEITIAMDVINSSLHFIELEILSDDTIHARDQLKAMACALELSENDIETRPYRDIVYTSEKK